MDRVSDRFWLWGLGLAGASDFWGFEVKNALQAAGEGSLFAARGQPMNRRRSSNRQP
jgi:hypothetical protein